MDSIRQYLLTVIAAACVCAVITHLFPVKGSAGTLVKFLCSVFMLVSVISPVKQLRFDGIEDFVSAISVTASDAVVAGETMSQESLSAIIKEQAEAYICDKAVAMNLELEVVVTLSDGSPPTPDTVTLTGKASPYAKSRLSNVIAEDLGISREYQIWT